MRRIIDLARRTPLHPQWLLGEESAVAAQLQLVARGRVLDIGCANRWVQGQLPAGCEYIGLDYPATGKLMYGARPDVFADASALPIADASVDTAVFLEVAEHLQRPREALGEIARVLCSQGHLLMSVPFLYPLHDEPHDYQRYTLHGLSREITMAGLDLESIKPGLGSAETAGLIASLALAGMAVESMHQRSPGILLLPLAALAVPVINLTAWVVGKLLPSWKAVTAGYVLIARKP